MRPLLIVLGLLCVRAFAAGQAIDIEINCTPEGACTSKQASVTLRGQDRLKVTITGADKWDWNCEIGGATDSADAPASDSNSKPCKSSGKDKKQITLTATPKSGVSEPGAPPKVAPPIRYETPFAAEPSGTEQNAQFVLRILSLIGAFACLALGCFIFQLARRFPTEHTQLDEALRHEVDQIKKDVVLIRGALAFGPVPPNSRVDAPLRPDNYAPNRRAADRGPLPYDAFMKALNSWSECASTLPDAIRGFRDVIQKTDGQISQIQLETLTQDIVTVAIRTTDGVIDPQRQNQDLQLSLRQLIAEAGLTEILPKPGEKYNPDEHTPREPSIKTDPRRTGIAEVRIRGLARNGKTVQKAELSLFD